MKNYIGTKELFGVAMNLGEYNEYRGWTIPEDEDPKREGYLVRYMDGYESWSPKGIFEGAYQDTDSMSFGNALHLLRKGFRIARKGWNGKNQFLFLVKGNSLEYRTDANLLPLAGKEVKHSDVIAICTSAGVIQLGWLASQTDMLSDDWMVYLREGTECERRCKEKLYAFIYEGDLVYKDGTPAAPNWALNALKEGQLQYDCEKLYIKNGISAKQEVEVGQYIMRDEEGFLWSLSKEVFEEFYEMM